MPAKTKEQPDFNNPYGYSEMEWAAQLDPAYAAARAEVRRLSVGEEGVLSVKVKELIVIGVLASRALQYGVAAHMRRAIDYGATKEELFEAIKAAAVPGGGVAYSVGVRALQELEPTFRTSLFDLSHFCIRPEVLYNLLTIRGDCYARPTYIP